jgi:hypothetical protein
MSRGLIGQDGDRVERRRRHRIGRLPLAPAAATDVTVTRPLAHRALVLGPRPPTATARGAHRGGRAATPGRAEKGDEALGRQEEQKNDGEAATKRRHGRRYRMARLGASIVRRDHLTNRTMVPRKTVPKYWRAPAATRARLEQVHPDNRVRSLTEGNSTLGSHLQSRGRGSIGRARGGNACLQRACLAVARL